MPNPSLPSVCFVAPRMYPVLARRGDIAVVGGAEVQQAFLARQLVQRGYPVSVASEDYGQPDAEVVDGIRIVKMFDAAAGLPVLRALHPRMTGTWKALRQADADIYCLRSASMTVGLVTAYCALHARKSVFAAANDFDFVPGRELIRDPWYRAMFRHGVRRVSRIVVQHPGQAVSCRLHYGRASTQIRSMFVPPSPAVHDAAAAEVLWCAVLRENKQVELFVELARRMPDTVFRIVGGPDASSYSQAISLRLTALAGSLPNLRFDGFQPYEDADRRFLQARVFINTALAEGFPNTFLQAWCRGVPTLSFVDVGAQIDGESVGQVCADLDAMESRLRHWLRDPAAWQRASINARRYFESHHSAQASTAAYIELFDGLCAAGKPALPSQA